MAKEDKKSKSQLYSSEKSVDERLLELGFADNLSVPNIRLMNKDGSLNVSMVGIARTKRWNLYRQFVKLRSITFYGVILFGYIFLNVIFATFYYSIGVDGLATSKEVLSWWDCLWFSTQTFTTVGYGAISPDSFLTNALASFEAFLGLIFFAVATGLVYGRFSNSKVDIRFSDNILVNSVDGESSLTVRLTNVANTDLSELEAILIMSYVEQDDGVLVRRYKRLPLQLTSISLLTTSWTIIHVVDEDSPCNLLNEKGAIQGVEFLLFISAFDEVFDQKIKVRTSYLEKDLVHSARFQPMTSHSSDQTIVDVDKLSSYDIL